MRLTLRVEQSPPLSAQASAALKKKWSLPSRLEIHDWLQRVLTAAHVLEGSTTYQQWQQRLSQPQSSVSPPACDYALSCTFVRAEEIRVLNARYRHKDKVTNILSFPSPVDFPLFSRSQKPSCILGDMVMAPEVIVQEAVEQGLCLRSYWSLLLVHGMLHLLGYDHEDPQEALSMESLEHAILGSVHPFSPLSPP